MSALYLIGGIAACVAMVSAAIVLAIRDARRPETPDEWMDRQW